MASKKTSTKTKISSDTTYKNACLKLRQLVACDGIDHTKHKEAKNLLDEIEKYERKNNLIPNPPSRRKLKDIIFKFTEKISSKDKTQKNLMN